MKKSFSIFISFFLLSLFLFQTQVFARIGVGVGTGKVVVDEDLRPGMIYELPPLSVINTGDEESKYEVEATYHQDQIELQPDSDWIKFSPNSFNLSPQEAKIVEIKLDLPIDAHPGDYFAFLEGHPVKTSSSGGASVGVAAAAKLYFTVVPANAFQAVYFKIQGWWLAYGFIIKIALGLGLTVLAAKNFKKYFNINIDIKKKPESKKDDQMS